MTLRARDIMTRDVETVSPDDDVAEVLTRLARVDFNGFPVVEDGSRDGPDGASDGPNESGGGRVVGIVTQGDLVRLFQPSDRTLWIPVGFPPFLESLTYGIDLSWDELDVGIDLVRNAGRPISEVMTEDVVTVAPDDDIGTVLALVADEERDINRLPVVGPEARGGSDVASGEGSGEGNDARAEDGTLVGIIARQDVLRALKEERDAVAGSA